MRDRSTMPRAFERFDRPQERRILGGVCAAIADATRIHPSFVRVAFIVLALANGVGIGIYLVLWLLLPDEGRPIAADGPGDLFRQRLSALRRDVGSGAEAFASALHERRRHSPWPRPLNRFWLGLGVVVAGAGILALSLDLFAWVTPLRAMGLAAVAAGVGVVLSAPEGS